MQTQTVRQAACFICSFVIGFILLALSLHLLPIYGLRLYAEQRSEKLDLLDHMAKRSTVAVFGTSHMHLGFDPRTFDKTLADMPLGNCSPLKTINLAIQGGSQTEQRKMALEYLHAVQDNPTQTCVIILELNAGANFTNDHLVHPRAINIYDADTISFVHSLASKPLPLKQRLLREAFGLSAGFLYFANVGMLSNRVFNPNLKPDILESDSIDDRRGYYPEKPTAKDAENVKEFFAKNAGVKPKTSNQDILAANKQLIKDLISNPAAPKGTPGNPLFFYVVAPLLADSLDTPVYPSDIETSQGPVPVINTARVDLYPELFEENSWRDPGHLSESGAKIFSGLVANGIKDWFKTHPFKLRCEGI